jgi:hypothetical protein
MSTDDPVLFFYNRMCDIVPPWGCPRIIERLNRAFTGRYWLPTSVVVSRKSNWPASCEGGVAEL